VKVVGNVAPRVAVVGAAVMGMAAAGMVGAQAAEVIVGSPVVLVVGDPSALTAGDAAVQADLNETGYDVQVVDDAAPSAVTPDTAVVVAAASADSTQLTTKYRDASVGVVALGYGSWVGMGVTAGSGWAQNSTSNLLVVDSAHPIANGLPQVFAPANSATLMQSVSDAYVPASADTVVVRSGVQSAHVVYTMSAGDLRADGTVTPANRVVLGMTDATLADLSEDGQQLLDNAINWADVTAAARLSSNPSAPVTKEYVKGSWKLNTYLARNGAYFTPSAINPGTASNPKDDGYLSSDTIVKKSSGTLQILPIANDGGKALRFPGPDDGNSTPGVDADASQVWVPHQDKFNPLGKRFKISVYVRPRMDNLVAGESPNIIQKGRVDQGNAHQWKISFNADAKTPVCTFQGATSKTNPQITRTEAFAPTTAAMTAGGRYRLTCELTADGQAVLHVYRWVSNQGFVDFNTSGYKGTAKAGIWVAPSTDISIGKKPGDTTDGDTYSGDIDNVVISRWEPVTQ